MIKNLLLSTVFKLLFFILFGLNAQAQTTYTFTGAVDHNWTESGNWTGGIPPNPLPSGDAIIINTGITCALEQNYTINGSFTIDGDFYFYDPAPNGTNYVVILTNNGTFINNGTFGINDAALKNFNSFTNNSLCENNGAIYNGDSSIPTSGTFTNSATVNNNGLFENSKGTIANSGAAASFENLGMFSELNNYDQITIDGNLVIGSLAGSNTGSNLSNEISGVITINTIGNLINATDNTITNKGLITNGGTIENNYQFSNYGNIVNNGTFMNYHEYYNGSIISSLTGTITNNGTIGNQWNFINEKGIFTNASTGTYTEPDRMVNMNLGFANEDIMINSGQITLGVYSNFYNNLTADMTNTGTLNIYTNGLFYNSGIFSSDNIINAYGNCYNDGTLGITAAGSMTVHSSGFFQNIGIMTSDGTIENNNHFENGNSLASQSGTMTLNGTFTNKMAVMEGFENGQGTVTLSGNIINEGNFVNNDILNIDGGTLTNLGGTILNYSLSNFGNFTILATGSLINTSGEINNGTSCTMTNENLITNNGTFKNFGILNNNNVINNLGIIENTCSGANLFTNNLTITSSGMGYIAHIGGNFINASTGTIQLDNTFYNNENCIVTNNGTMNVNDDFSNDGSVKGTGTITQAANFTNSGTGEVKPGNSIGTLKISGNFDLGTGTFEIEADSPSSYDIFNSNDGGILDISTGTIDFVFDNTNFTNGDKFNLFTGFSSVTNPSSITNNNGYTIVHNGGGEFEITLGAILPVELIAFTVRSEENTVLLNWQTANEKSNEGFHIERRNNSTWEVIGFVAGHGTTTTEHDYQFRDEKPEDGINYYRLRQIDLDGVYEFSNTISIDMKFPKNSYHSGIYPNPTNGVSTLEVYMEKGQNGMMEVFDFSGKLMHSQNIQSVENGKMSIPLNFQDFSSGIYMLIFKSKNQFIKHKVMVEK